MPWGSEYPAVVISISMRHCLMLRHKLIYNRNSQARHRARITRAGSLLWHATWLSRCVARDSRRAVSLGDEAMVMTTERIEINPAVMLGKPVIRGTRITVELILRKLAEGETESELLEDYPHLTPEDIRAAIAYGAASVAHEEVVLLADANPSKS
jgi:uncharacterized protein (DUF433 family)